MKTTGRLFNRGLAVTAAVLFLAAAPLAAQGTELKANETTVGGPNTGKLCVKDYGKTPAEAFAAGMKRIQEADAQLGEYKMHGNVRIRILPEKENGLFVAVVYSHPDNGLCTVRPDRLTARVQH
jgi:hypothetical protein